LLNAPQELDKCNGHTRLWVSVIFRLVPSCYSCNVALNSCSIKQFFFFTFAGAFVAFILSLDPKHPAPAYVETF
jgi:hypothetical protein